jgi:hypothetical protein
MTGIKFFLSFVWDLVLGIWDFNRGVKESLPSQFRAGDCGACSEA